VIAASITVSATGQKNVRQKNGISYFSVLHFSVRWVLVAETTIKAVMGLDRRFGHGALSSSRSEGVNLAVGFQPTVDARSLQPLALNRR
jgi:hypothetical protein